jgi:probable phosphoglycerate mutase
MQRRMIFLIRHAQPVLPDGRKRFLGQADPPLSLQGLAEAKRLPWGLTGYRLSGIYSSDLMRSRQTAAIIAERLGMQYYPIPELSEISMGIWEQMTFDEVRIRYPEAFKQRGIDIANYRTPGGESFADLQRRVLPVFFDIVKNSTGNIAIVSHSGVNRVILCTLSSLPLDKLLTFQQHYATVNIIEKKGSRFSIIKTNVSLERAYEKNLLEYYSSIILTLNCNLRK